MKKRMEKMEKEIAELKSKVKTHEDAIEPLKSTITRHEATLERHDEKWNEVRTYEMHKNWQ
jgi:uncharacterized coiled-coil protein SlyX